MGSFEGLFGAVFSLDDEISLQIEPAPDRIIPSNFGRMRNDTCVAVGEWADADGKVGPEASAH